MELCTGLVLFPLFPVYSLRCLLDDVEETLMILKQVAPISSSLLPPRGVRQYHVLHILTHLHSLEQRT